MNLSFSQWTATFDALLRCTLQASVLILLILVLRRVLAKRLQGRWLFALWFVMLIRLTLPWTPASPLSLYGILPGFNPPATQIAPEGMQPPADFPSPASWRYATPPVSAGVEKVLTPKHDNAVARQSAWDIKRALYVIWLAGMLVLGAIFAGVNMVFRRTIRREPVVVDERILRLLEDCKAQMGVRTVLGLVLSDHVKSPALYGFVRPRLLLPRNLPQILDRAELRHIFMHELAHLKRHDVLIGWLMSLLQVLHWPNPLVWLGLHHMRLDRELACDSLALSVLRPDTPRDYGRTLLHVFESFHQRQYLPALAGLVDNPSQLQRRITMIAQPHPASRRSTLLGISLLIALGLVTLTDSAKVVADGENQNAANSAASASAGSVTFSPKVSYTIYPGKGLDIIHIGDSAERVEAVFGKAPATEDGEGTRWLNYRKAIGIDFLMNKHEDKVVEIRFNEGFKAALLNGIKLGDSLDTVLAKSGGAKKTVDAKKDQADTRAMGDNRVLYKTSAYGVVQAYKFIDGTRGVLYWFGANKKLTQIVVFHSDRDDDSGEVELPEGSYINDKGCIVDKIDYPFVDDPQVIGKWESVDFVRTVEQFNPNKRAWQGDLFLRGLVFKDGGQASWPWHGWTKGLLTHDGDRTASRYIIKDIGGTSYLFLEWKSGDYTIRHQKPWLYVLRKLPVGSTQFEKPYETFAASKNVADLELLPDSRIDPDGRIVDNIDRPFVNDPDVVGRWESVDFVRAIEDCQPGSRQSKGGLFLEGLVFLKDGKMPQPWQTWTNGFVLHHGGDHTASKYTIKDINGAKYMFFEWKSGDYIFGHRKPYYYVLKKVE